MTIQVRISILRLNVNIFFLNHTHLPSYLYFKSLLKSFYTNLLLDLLTYIGGDWGRLSPLKCMPSLPIQVSIYTYFFSDP